MSIFFAAALMMAQAPAVQPAIAQPSVPAAATEKEKKICRVDENESSSRLRKRVCLTQTEWERKDSGVSANDLKNIGGR
jgi:hypothetical protein